MAAEDARGEYDGEGVGRHPVGLLLQGDPETRRRRNSSVSILTLILLGFISHTQSRQGDRDTQQSAFIRRSVTRKKTLNNPEMLSSLTHTLGKKKKKSASPLVGVSEPCSENMVLFSFKNPTFVDEAVLHRGCGS